MNFRPKRAIATLFAVFASGLAVFGQGWSQNVSPLPTPTGYVNDYVGVIDAATKQTLEAKMKEFRDRSGVELAVAVVNTTGNRDIFDYSLAVARGWGIGAKADDNPGALLLIAVDDRKYFTQISKDLEDELPDGLAGSLQRQFLVPEFKKGNYGKGISDTIDAYVDQIENRTSGFNPPPPAATTDDDDGTSSLSNLVCCFAIFIFIVVVILSNRNRSKSDDDQDRWGGGGSGVMDVLPWIILSGSGSSGSSSGSNWGGSSDWGSSGSDWGGFGGGGDFGGGGAGGSW